MTVSRRTKIVATLGPSSSERSVIRRLVEAGADVFRLNFSHGTADDHRARARLIREVAAETGRPIAILQDLQGPKFRIGALQGGSVVLERGNRFRLDLSPEPGDPRRVQFPHPDAIASLAPGAHLLLDDGRIRLRVVAVDSDAVDTEVLVGGVLKDRKGVNMPDTTLNTPILTEKDLADIAIGQEIGVDWVALSFVQKPGDLLDARVRIPREIGLVSKLEKPSALGRLDDIIALSDAVMIARGDLGVEIPAEDVPGWQKTIIAACRRSGKPVIVATQMLESMTVSPLPTRAEASDVATAVFDGADAVMLSAESAAGQFPVEAVATMARIVAAAEAHMFRAAPRCPSTFELEEHIPHAVAASAARLAGAINACAIVAFTTTGTTALRIARERPVSPILAVTPTEELARRLQLVWSVRAHVDATIFEVSDLHAGVARVIQRFEIGAPGDAVVAVAGLPFWTPGSTNLIHVVRRGE